MSITARRLATLPSLKRRKAAIRTLIGRLVSLEFSEQRSSADAESRADHHILLLDLVQAEVVGDLRDRIERRLLALARAEVGKHVDRAEDGPVDFVMQARRDFRGVLAAKPLRNACANVQRGCPDMADSVLNFVCTDSKRPMRASSVTPCQVAAFQFND